ncbi:glycosyltransferase [Bacteroides sp.]
MINNIRCALITMAPFPIGNVSTIRYTSYLKSLLRSGVTPCVFIISPSYMARHNNRKYGVYNGIYYRYMTRISWRKKLLFLIKAIYYVIGLFKSIYYLKKNKIDCVILYHQETFAYYFYWIVLKILSIAYITDKSEYPYGFSKMSSLKKNIEIIKLKVFDGFIVMTHELTNFYSRVHPLKKDVFHLPMTINLDRFAHIQKDNSFSPYIAVVFGIHNRDGLYESVVSYHYYRNIAKDIAYRLVLIGNYELLPDWTRISRYIIDNNLSDYVDIKGELPINEVPKIIFNAKCLLTTPNEYISGGFPTKLGEYLLSGVPVVATLAGEIGFYLKNKKHAMLVAPGDYVGIAESLYLLQTDSTLALKISQEAKELVYEAFNADKYAKSLTDFLLSMIEYKRCIL